MPKKKLKETPEEQAARFKQAIREMLDAGELDPTDADEKFERAMAGVVKSREAWFEGEEDQETPP
jgi:guanylate kinase